MEEFEKYLSKEQVELLQKFYENNPQLFRPHKNTFMSLEKHHLMKEINEKFGYFSFYEKINRKSIHKIIVEDKNYLLIPGSNGGKAFYNLETNEWHHFYCVDFKTTGVRIWLSMQNNYRINGNEYNQFYRSVESLDKESLEIIQNYAEYKYIKLEELKLFCPYVMLMYCDNKQRIWQIEMLQKGDFIKLASELACESSEVLDFNILRTYPEYFKRKGIGLVRYRELEELHKKGFTDPAFIYIGEKNTWYCSWNENKEWIRFLERSGVNKKRIIQYINNRKSTILEYGIKFLDEYLLYLRYCERIGLDLTRNKYAFPDNLDKEFESILRLDEDTENKYKRLLMNIQLNLDEKNDSEKYAKYKEFMEQEAIRAEEVRKERGKLRDQKLVKLWNMGRKFRFELSDKLVIVAPTSSEDLFIEGKTLNHCVGDYVDRIAEGRTMVYFVRKKGYENKPYFTVEISGYKLIQARTTNQHTDEEITNLLNEWIPKHKSDLLRIN